MNGKVIVITGASGALGKVVAEAARARGAKLAEIDHAASSVPPAPDRLVIGGIDLSDAAQASQAIETTAAHFGRLDALINIAGAFAFETVADGDPRTWQRLHAINVMTALNASRAATPPRASPGGGGRVSAGAGGARRGGAGRAP